MDFAGLAWPLPAGDADSPDGRAPSRPIPGRPLLYCADTPVLSRLPETEPHYALLAPPAASPFFRSTAWPSLVYNLLALAQPPSTPSTLPTFSESDLTACTTLSLAGPPLPPSEDTGDLRPLALFFGLAAFALLQIGRAHV